MSEKPNESAASIAVSTQLHAISQILRGVHQLDSQTQAALADLVDEVSSTLEGTTVDNAKLARLTESAATLVKAVHERHDEGILASAQERLLHAAVAVESESPGLASLTRRVAEMLSNVGI